MAPARVMREFTPEEQEEIVNLYKKDVSRRELMKKYRCSDKPICRILKEHHVPLRKTMKQENEYCQTIFDRIDTPEKVYWLGFIVGDGYLNEKRYKLKIALSIKDMSHLYKFCDFLKRSHENVKAIDGNYNNKICYVVVSSKPIVSRLVELGIRQGKSGHEQVPDFPYKYANSYLRGLMDADGSFSKSINLSNSVDNIKFMQDVFQKELDIEPNKILEHQHTFRTYYYTKKDCKKIVEFLYRERSVYLERKYEIARTYLERCI